MTGPARTMITAPPNGSRRHALPNGYSAAGIEGVYAGISVLSRPSYVRFDFQLKGSPFHKPLRRSWMSPFFRALSAFRRHFSEVEIVTSRYWGTEVKARRR